MTVIREDNRGSPERGRELRGKTGKEQKKREPRKTSRCWTEVHEPGEGPGQKQKEMESMGGSGGSCGRPGSLPKALWQQL